MDPKEETDPFDELNSLLESIEQHPEEQVRNHVRGIVAAMLDLHHAALQRMLEILGSTQNGKEILGEFSNDDFIKAILLAHDLMPESLEKRVENALENARKNLKIYDADVVLLRVKDGVAYLKLIAGGAAANISTAVLKGEIEQALHLDTPDLQNVQYEEVIDSPKTLNLVQIRPRRDKNIDSNQKFIPLLKIGEIPNNDLRIVEFGDLNVLLCNIAGTIYAFQNRCPHQNLSLENGILEGGVLTCPWHGYQFDVRQKGKCLTDPALKIESLSMKIENDVVKVVLPLEV
jgi:nitrite reductase/ring-hydroxylating ferredoxin subunit/Fe-S cluster biogenesis protein NfuA